MHVSGHLMAANSRALARAGLNAESEDPPGGIIRRRTGSREPDGVLEETAATALRPFMGEPISDPLSTVRLALEEYASYGLTTAQDGAASSEVVSLLRAAAQTDQLIMDVVAYPIGMGDPQQIG